MEITLAKIVFLILGIHFTTLGYLILFKPNFRNFLRKLSQETEEESKKVDPTSRKLWEYYIPGIGSLGIGLVALFFAIFSLI